MGLEGQLGGKEPLTALVEDVCLVPITHTATYKDL